MKALLTIVAFAFGVACSRESGQEQPSSIGPATKDYVDASDAPIAPPPPAPMPSASTSPADLAAAEALFQEARKLMSEGKYAAACPKFEESYKLDPADGGLLNLARCEELLGDVTKACAHYAAALKSIRAKTPVQADREKLILERMAAAKCTM